MRIHSARALGEAAAATYFLVGSPLVCYSGSTKTSSSPNIHDGDGGPAIFLTVLRRRTIRDKASAAIRAAKAAV
jgi:hypothetical protein